MKNIILKVKEKDEILIFLVIFIIAVGVTLNLNITAGDELWNFQNAYKMYNGFEIYKDINIIVTPLFFVCTEIIFQLFGVNLFIFRISHCVIMTILYLFTYKILKELKISKTFSLFVILIIMIQGFFLLFRTSFNYNNLALMVVMIGIYLLIKDKFQENYLIQAIISIIILLIKQNIGVYYMIGYTVFIILLKNATKSKKMTKWIKYIFVIFLGIIAFIATLVINNSFYNFINYTLGGISEFANKNFLLESSCVIFVVILTVINIILSIFFLKNKYFSEDELKKLRILFSFSLPLVLIIYPIINWTHGLIAMYVVIINLVYMLYNIFKDFEEKLLKEIKIFNYILVIILLVFSTYNLYGWITYVKSDKYVYSWEEPFFGGIISEEEFNKNKKIIKYIGENDKKVIVCSNRAALYMIPLKINNGDFDLPLIGNLGVKGEEGLIGKVRNMVNVQFLIYSDNKENHYQEAVKVIDYIKNEKTCVGRIEEFDIYE